MLHAIAFIHRLAAVIGMHRDGHRDGTLGVKQPVALILGHAEVVGDRVELLLGHFEHGTGVNAHLALSPWRDPYRPCLLFAAERGGFV